MPCRSDSVKRPTGWPSVLRVGHVALAAAMRNVIRGFATANEAAPEKVSVRTFQSLVREVGGEDMSRPVTQEQRKAALARVKAWERACRRYAKSVGVAA